MSKRVAVIGFLALSILGPGTALATDGLTDPTRPSHYLSGEGAFLNTLKKEYFLHSIIIGDSRRVAVINGERVNEGDHIRGARVGSINKSSVTLTIDGANINIELQQSNFKTR